MNREKPNFLVTCEMACAFFLVVDRDFIRSREL